MQLVNVQTKSKNKTGRGPGMSVSIEGGKTELDCKQGSNVSCSVLKIKTGAAIEKLPQIRSHPSANP